MRYLPFQLIHLGVGATFTMSIGQPNPNVDINKWTEKWTF